jgi:AraC-like DNA-binding protein
MIATIVDMRQRDDVPDSVPLECVARLHALYPSVPIVGYVDFTPQRARDILTAAHAGASEIILREVDDLHAVANRIIDMGTSIDVATQIQEAIADIVPEQLHTFFQSCVEHAATGVSVNSVTTRLRRNRKTLSNWLAAAELPPPFRIVGWMRILVAARMLEDTSRSAEKVARELHFVSGTALRNMMRRYLGVGPETLRQNGGFAYALPKFLEELQSPQRAKR